jgi:phospholipase/carboxylesterase
MMGCLPRIEAIYPPDGKPDAVIIVLHGLGADGSDFAGIVPELRLPDTLCVRFLFPHAPSIPVTINNGFVMPAWYDILEADVGRRVDDVQLRASAAAIHKMIDQQLELGIASDRIILGGFSQGGAVVLEAALTYPKPLGGLLSMSSYFATADSIKPHPANRNLPIMICHGSYDQIVTESRGKACRDQLVSMGYRTEFRTYPMEHSVCLEEIRDVSRWLQDLLLIREGR